MQETVCEKEEYDTKEWNFSRKTDKRIQKLRFAGSERGLWQRSLSYFGFKKYRLKHVFFSFETIPRHRFRGCIFRALDIDGFFIESETSFLLFLDQHFCKTLLIWKQKTVFVIWLVTIKYLCLCILWMCLEMDKSSTKTFFSQFEKRFLKHFLYYSPAHWVPQLSFHLK